MADITVSRTWIIYKITCLVESKSYIGLTKGTITHRWSNHVWRAQTVRSKPKSLLHWAIKRHGKVAFNVETLTECFSLLEAAVTERGLIAEHGTMRPRGYNVATGGMGTPGVRRPHSAETRAKIGEANKRRIFSAETRHKMGVSAHRRRASEMTKEKFRQHGKALSREHMEKMKAALWGTRKPIRTLRLIRKAIQKIDAGESRNYRAEHGRFSTRICIGATKKHLGMFASPEEALARYREALVERHIATVDECKKTYGPNTDFWDETISIQYAVPSPKLKLPFQPAPQHPKLPMPPPDPGRLQP